MKMSLDLTPFSGIKNNVQDIPSITKPFNFSKDLPSTLLKIKGPFYPFMFSQTVDSVYGYIFPRDKYIGISVLYPITDNAITRSHVLSARFLSARC